MLPNITLYFPQAFIVYFTLKKESDSEDEYMRKMADQMLVKFKKYWIEFSVVLAITVVLDPRYKLPFVDWCYQKFYGYASSLNIWRFMKNYLLCLENMWVMFLHFQYLLKWLVKLLKKLKNNMLMRDLCLWCKYVFFFLFIYLYYVIYILPKLISIMLFLHVGIWFFS